MYNKQNICNIKGKSEDKVRKHEVRECSLSVKNEARRNPYDNEVLDSLTADKSKR